MQSVTKYAFSSRILHWLIAVLVLTLIPVGWWMASRAEINLFDNLTNTLYAWHKAIGFTLLCLMLVRVIVKVRNGAPAYPGSLPRWQVVAAKSLHHLLYLLLVVTPLLGWAGVSAFPALITLGGYDLPAMPFVPQDQALATRLFGIHGVFAITLGVLVTGHIAAAVIHLAIRKDGVFQRMWFGE